MTELLHFDLTGKIIGVYYDVYNGLSHTYPEYIYENAMMRDLTRSGIDCVQQDEYQVFYKEKLVGVQRLDIFVANEVVVECKVKPSLIPLDKAQTMSYLKTVGKHVGFVFNFGNSKPEFQRAYFARDKSRLPLRPHVSVREDILFPDLSYSVIGGLFEVHNELGPGYIHRIYTDACVWEMHLRGLDVKPLKHMTVYYRGEPIGNVNFQHLLIEDKIMLFPVAVSNTDQIKLQNLRLWMASQGISLGILANFYSDHLVPEFMKEVQEPRPAG